MNLTIITAAWHAENLPKVIESIDNQTYQDFQHIIVNDNNPEVREVMKPLCDGVKRHWIDCGVRGHFYGAIARNIGAMMAFSYIHHSKRDIENEWICFHDDDNRWETNHLQSMIEVAEANPQATLIATDAVWIGSHDKIWREIRPCRISQDHCDLGQFAYRTSLFRAYGYFHAHPRSKQRYDWRLIEKIVKGEGMGKVAFTNQPTFLMNYKKR